ncbi:hypothetical protein ACMFMG_001121 [Clarireedia jacksonii]
MFAALAIAATAIPLFMEAILHMESLPALVMLFPLASSADKAILLISGSLPRSSKQKALFEIPVVIFFSIIILYDEYRFTVPGIAFEIAGLISSEVSKALVSLACEENRVNQSPSFSNSSRNGFIILTAVFGLLITGPASYCIENASFLTSYYGLISVILPFCIGTTSGAISSGGSWVVFSPPPFKEMLPSPAAEVLPVSDIFASNYSAVLILWLSLLSSSVSYVSYVQFIAYWITIVTLFVFSRHTVGFDFRSSFHATWSRKEVFISHIFGRSTEALCLIMRKVLLQNFCLTSAPLLVWLLVSTILAVKITTQPEVPAQLDKDFVAQSRFYIVVSMYDEDPTSVGMMLSSIKVTAFLNTVETRVVLYIKNPTSDLSELQDATGADIVGRLENLGREGGTCLHHIIKNWDHLANQTMFTQAHAHNLRELIPRIDNFLVPNTGMLSLGFTGVLCNCQNCADRWGWEDKWALLPILHKELHRNNTCSEPVLLSYNGQLMASARRIRGVRLGIYQESHRAITSTTGWSHDPAIIGDELDKPDAPYFGYTVERIWNLLMQCSNVRIAALCPSLLGKVKWRRLGRIEDCQCLD